MFGTIFRKALPDQIRGPKSLIVSLLGPFDLIVPATAYVFFTRSDAR
ncbi:MAG TPA: hypothetical protein VKT17_10695 [Acidobacteriota bacterium]|nr:hypothetical protein [Acidobacteriota bacterium]